MVAVGILQTIIPFVLETKISPLLCTVR